MLALGAQRDPTTSEDLNTKAIITTKLAAEISDDIGFVPDALTAAIRPLTAAQRDEFVAAWRHASDDQRVRPAEEWALREGQRDAFAAFQTAMLSPAPDTATP